MAVVLVLAVIAYLVGRSVAQSHALLSAFDAAREADGLAERAIRERDDEIRQLVDRLTQHETRATRSLLGARVVANLNDGSSIRGVMTAEHDEALVLEHAEYLAGQQPEAFAGRAVLPRAHVVWIQALGSE